MGYTNEQGKLISLFSSDSEETIVPGAGIRIINTGFVSDVLSRDLFSGSDFSISENISFSYPVFVPASPGSRKVIFLLHGLNERSWNKYLTWAGYLSEATGSYVIMFPISFHINRSPVSWKDPRTMLRLLIEKTAVRGEVRSSSYANIALSNRLHDDPRRFLKSGYQTICDIVKLTKQIKNGNHPVVPSCDTIDIFAYSIGAFMAEIMMMADPEGLFTRSRLFMFCGGSVFSSMYGESKYIMDRLAYEKLYSFYRDSFEEEIRNRKSVLTSLSSGNIGLAFRAMIGFGRFRDERNKALARLKDQLFSIALARDRVIPAPGIVETIGNKCRVEVLDFEYLYTHENPFPVLTGTSSSKVDKAFDTVFRRASGFFMGNRLSEAV